VVQIKVTTSGRAEAAWGTNRADFPMEKVNAIVKMARIIDVRMPPQVRPIAIQRELEQTLKTTGLDFEVDVYKSLLGHDGKNVELLVKCAEEVYRHLFGEDIKLESPDRARIWTDTNIFNELGIPAIKIGCSRTRAPER
jgi:acetylornithine deacetylase/succinyl-diaminopimelate desuccinylase-like protein